MLDTAVAAGTAAAGAPPSLTTAMLEAGASNVLEPGFAQLLDVVPPLAAADQSPRCLAGAGEKKEEPGVRRAVISRWASGLLSGDEKKRVIGACFFCTGCQEEI